MNLIVTRYPPAAGAEGLELLAFMQPAVEAAPRTMDGVTLSEILARGRQLLAAKKPLNPSKLDVATLRTCLQRSVKIAKAEIERDDGFAYIRVDLINTLPWALAFAEIEYSVKTKGRTVPWTTEKFGMSISGGIEPKETGTLRTNAFHVPSDAVNLETTATVLDVADVQKRHVVGETFYQGDSRELVSIPCP